MTQVSLDRRMTSQDAGFLYFEKPTTPLHIGSVSVLDGPLDRDTLIAHMAGRMHRLPRYRQKAIFAPFNIGHPAWEDDPDFSLERHVDEVQLPPEASEDDFRRAVAARFAPMLPRDRPLWSMTVFRGLPGGKSAVMMLVHHCMVDGVSGVELLMVATDLAADVPHSEPEPYNPAPRLSPAEHATSAYFDSLKDVLDETADAYRLALDPERQMQEMQAMAGSLMAAAPMLSRPAPPTPWNLPVSGKRVYASVATPFLEIRGVRAVLGGTVNDVVLTTLSGALGAYMRERGASTSGVELRAMVPVNVRTESQKDTLGNQVSMFVAPLPVGIEDASERHNTVVASMNRLKESNQAGGFSVMSRAANRVPPGMQAWAGFMAGGQALLNLVCTNVPGPQIPLYLGGRMIEQMYPLVPLSYGMGLNFALLSYNGTLAWGICADPVLVPDVERVAALIARSFDDLKSAAIAAAPAPG